jgi:predicted ATP-dependent endonuclease of OLD family
MQLKSISVRNFRLLRDITVILEKTTTVIVGRNNSGKTSLTEIMKRVLDENHPSFRLEDFSFDTHDEFWNAFLASTCGASEPDIRKILPAIEIRMVFEYDVNVPLGALGNFVIDLDVQCNEAHVVARYAPKEGKIVELFRDLTDTAENSKPNLLRILRERIPSAYGLSFAAVDPNDPANEKAVDSAELRAACLSGFISAQRGLDDATNKERVVLGKVLENLFTTAKKNTADEAGHSTVARLENAVKEIQQKMGEDFNLQLDALLPALSIFGYQDLANTKLQTETILDVGRLLTNHTKVRYEGTNGIHLPEAYNGLGMRNIILILLQLREFFKRYNAMEPTPSVHLVFIEEPEVHLHPQMQEVFIRQLTEISAAFNKEHGTTWPIQFIVSTHSSHIANEARFEAIRYFVPSADEPRVSNRTVVKDLRIGLAGKGEPDREFLHQYMTLTRCDLFFADKAILIEGTAERLLVPKMIQKLDGAIEGGKKLGSQYISIVEIGGAYAHIFFDLLDFLGLRTLIITDIDSVGPTNQGRRSACQVGLGERTSNACIKKWFGNTEVEPAFLVAADKKTKERGKRRIAFQHPEEATGPCGRTFEDAFMLANVGLFPEIAAAEVQQREKVAWESVKDLKKSEFALKHLLEVQNWNTPRYIQDGLIWLAAATKIDTDMAPAVATPAAVVSLAPVEQAA